MTRWVERLLVVGHGGTGRTTALRSWADDAERTVDGTVTWVRGGSDQYVGSMPPAAVDAALASIEHADALAVDDAHWLDDVLIDAIAATSSRIPTAAARAPWPDSAALRRLGDSLTTHGPATTLEMLSPHEIADLPGRSNLVDLTDEQLRRFTGGSPALTMACIDARWHGEAGGETGELHTAIVDAVVHLARQSGPDVVAVLQLMAVGLTLETAVASAPDTGSEVERRVRVSGLVDGREILPVTAAALRADMTLNERRSLGRLVSPGSVSSDAQAALDRASDDPVVRARASFRIGDADAERLVSGLGDAPDSADLRFGVDLRAMRWESAAKQSDDDSLSSLANAFLGHLPHRSPKDNGVAEGVLSMIHALGTGDDVAAVALGGDVVERAVATDFDVPLGWSPAAIAALTAIASGDPRAASHVLDTAITNNLSGDGEQRCHRLLRSLAGVAVNEFSEALDLVREGTGDGWPVRDRFLLATLDAAIARRSGDTTRLRSAWQHCEPLIVGQPVSWLLTDALIEILAAGARLGDERRVAPAVDRLATQIDRLDPSGPGAVTMHWVRLQLAIARGDWEESGERARRLGELEAVDGRSRARSAAGKAWQSVAAARFGAASIDLAAVDDAVERLVAVDDAWEASRLLGQAALDHADATVARTLLERARQLVTDPIETADELLAAGLSEREAEVARLVAEGRTYKEIGGQLFISAKTVEHHVARIRQRLGASTRAEMLATIREMS